MLTLLFLFWWFRIVEHMVVDQKCVLKSDWRLFSSPNNADMFVKDHLYFSCPRACYKMFTK